MQKFCSLQFISAGLAKLCDSVATLLAVFDMQKTFQVLCLWTGVLLCSTVGNGEEICSSYQGSCVLSTSAAETSS